MKKAILAVLVLAMVSAMVQAQLVDITPVPVAKPTATVTSTVPAVVRAPVVVTSTVPVAVVSTTAAVNEDRFSVGVYGGYTTGGDIQTPSMSIGGQAVYSATDHLSFEASLLKMQDDMDLTTMRVIQFGFMPRLEAQVWNKTHLYGGVGISYNIFDVDLGTPGFTAEIESAVGLLATVGMSYRVSNRVEIFTDCRFSWVKTTAVVDGPCDFQALVDGSADSVTVGAGVNVFFF